MKHLLLICFLALTWKVAVANAFTGNIGIVNMQELVKDSGKMESINASLNRRFSSQRNKILAMDKNLHNNIKTLKRNKLVMTDKKAQDLQNKIDKQSAQLRVAQFKLQKAAFAAQNKAIKKYMEKITKITAEVAKKRKLDLVLPEGIALYVKNPVYITDDLRRRLQ